MLGPGMSDERTSAPVAEARIKMMLDRLAQRSRVPRSWLIARHPEGQWAGLPDADAWKRQYDETATTVNGLLWTVSGFSLFCLLALGTSDASLIRHNSEITLPFTGTKVSMASFLLLAPAILLALVFYLHIFVGHLWRIRTPEAQHRSPFLFNLPYRLPKLLSGFLLYWLAPVVLAAFTAKALPTPQAPILLIVTALATAALAWAQVRRCGDDERRYRAPVLGALFFALVVLGTLQLAWFPTPLVSRG